MEYRDLVLKLCRQASAAGIATDTFRGWLQAAAAT